MKHLIIVLIWVVIAGCLSGCVSSFGCNDRDNYKKRIKNAPEFFSDIYFRNHVIKAYSKINPCNLNVEHQKAWREFFFLSDDKKQQYLEGLSWIDPENITTRDKVMMGLTEISKQENEIISQEMRIELFSSMLTGTEPDVDKVMKRINKRLGWPEKD